MKKIIYIFAIGWLLLFSACTDGFEEMNKDPFNPTTTTIEPVFNKLLSTLPLGWQEQAGLHNTFYYYNSQLAGRFGISGYLLDNSINDVWNSYYQALSNYRLLERLFDADDSGKDLTNVKAMAKILMAYKTLKMIEAFGDIPYYDAGKAVQGADYFRIPYDDDQKIYKSCLTDLKWAVDNIKENDDKQFTVGTFDTVLSSDLLKWKKWANSMILRHALRIYDVEQSFAGGLIAAVINNPVIEEDEDMCLWPKKLGITNGARGWSFWSENMLRMGTAMWSEMSSNDATDGSGIYDPRCFIFFEPNDNDEWIPYPQNPTATTPPEIVGKAYKKSRDKNWENKGGTQYASFNFFLVRDEWDIPEFIQTAADVKLLKAEAYAKGAGVPKDLAKAKTEYEAALRTSVNFWYSLIDVCDIWSHHKPNVPSTEDIDAFIAHANVAWDDTKALDLIYTQRWIEAFRQPWEANHIWNYTHKTPRDESGAYHADDYKLYRIHYPLSEQDNNKVNWLAAPYGGDKDTENQKLFWQK